MSTVRISDAERTIGEVERALWRLRDLPAQERNDTAGPLVQRLRQKLARILSPLQTERLDQLARQAEGITCVLEPGVVVKPGLSSRQIESIRISLNAWNGKLNALYENSEMASESDRVTYIRRLREETERNVRAVLNSSQQRDLLALMGRPFDLSRVQIIACKAPELKADTWINPPVTASPKLSGKVTVVHFYAFGCGNCIRTLPYYNRWREHFPSNVFQIIGIHRPETQKEREVETVKQKAAEAGIEYPVAIDNESLMWDAWANHTWPSIYVLDKNGFVRLWWYGELNWQGAESEKYLRSKIQELIDERS